MKKTTANRRSKKAGVDDVKQGPEKQFLDLELENGALKKEIEELRNKLAGVSSPQIVGIQNQKVESGECSHGKPTSERKGKANAQSQRSAQKPKHEEAVQNSVDEIQKLKAQKVQLQCKNKLDSMQFRKSKASLEKQILQLRKEHRRYQIKVHMLLALNQQHKKVAQRKIQEATVSMKRLKQLMESRTSIRKRGLRKGNSPGIMDIENELDISNRLDELYSDYEHQMEKMDEEIERFRLEIQSLKTEDSRLMVDGSEADSILMDSEIRQLRDEFTRLSTIVSQIEIAKLPITESHNSQVDPIQLSVSSGTSIQSSNIKPSPTTSIVGTTEAKTETKKACCSCSKKSLCKTQKCGCRAAGGSCGPSCGCTASKCTNREDSLKQDELLQNESLGCDIMGEHGPRKQPLRDIGNTLVKPIAEKTVRRRKARNAT